jgi:hypothetical protein
MNVLENIAKHAQEMGQVSNTVETGSGKTTLLFSHLSQHHLVFAVDDGSSITQVRNSPYFNSAVVQFVEGPSQVTLPTFSFAAPLQIALIDGPHGYPFPDLEYYYFYPQIVPGGLLLIDDIQIPSVNRMFEIVKAGDMFSLLEIIDDMAFFRRTSAPTIDPRSDSWWLQGYNRQHYEELTGVSTKLRFRFRRGATRFFRSVYAITPAPIRKVIPIDRIRSLARRL